MHNRSRLPFLLNDVTDTHSKTDWLTINSVESLLIAMDEIITILSVILQNKNTTSQSIPYLRYSLLCIYQNNLESTHDKGKKQKQINKPSLKYISLFARPINDAHCNMDKDHIASLSA